MMHTTVDCGLSEFTGGLTDEYSIYMSHYSRSPNVPAFSIDLKQAAAHEHTGMVEMCCYIAHAELQGIPQENIQKEERA